MYPRAKKIILCEYVNLAMFQPRAFLPVLRYYSTRRSLPRPKAIIQRSLMTIKPLDFKAGPLVWVDCEMTGLDPRKDKIIEIAVRTPRDIPGDGEILTTDRSS